MQAGIDSAALRRYFTGLQQRIVAALGEIDGKAFGHDAWQRPEGGDGISRVLEDGKVFERAGVRFTTCPLPFVATNVRSRVSFRCRAMPRIASSQVISSQWSEPGRRTFGVLIRAGLLMSSLSEIPFGQRLPRLMGLSGSPSMWTTAEVAFFARSQRVWMITPHETAQ